MAEYRDENQSGRTYPSGKDGEDMALIPAGYYMMGAPEGRGYAEVHPRHRVWVDAFYMEKHEVTFDQYDKFCGATGRKKPSDAGWGRGNKPVIKINWDDANAAPRSPSSCFRSCIRKRIWKK